jgi:L-ascorbate metabolism protein UlaG (beta-lactamase superfamily)/quinol monooxygenase YgiN
MNLYQMKQVTLLLLGFMLFSEVSAQQESKQMVRLAKLVIDPNQLEQYKAMLKEEAETSMRIEPGVLTLFAVQEKDNPTHFTILEIYTDSAAYRAHIQTPHFIRYKTGTKDMVKSLELVETTPLIPDMKIKVDSAALKKKKYQAKAPPTKAFGKEAFAASTTTTARWLGMGGFLINSRGTTLMIDPLLRDFDMPVMIDFPIKAADVPGLDAVLITHSDNDHYSIPTNRDLKTVTKAFHSTKYVDSLMKAEGLPSFGHTPNEKFKVGPLTIKMVPVDHAWQNAYPGTAKRTFKNEDCTGFLIETPDGTIWAQGDSRLLPEHLAISPPPDAILFDFSDSEWHFTFEGAVKIANAYPDTPLLLCHWGSVDAPDFPPFNGDPERLKKAIVNPERIKVLAPGEPFTVTKIKRPQGKKPTKK